MCTWMVRLILIFVWVGKTVNNRLDSFIHYWRIIIVGMRPAVFLDLYLAYQRGVVVGYPFDRSIDIIGLASGRSLLLFS